MAKDRAKSPRARLFVALDLPEDVRSRLGAWQRRELDPIAALRPVRPEGLHLTLCFLGYLPEKRIPEVTEAVRGIDPRPVALRLRPEPVPVPRKRPRLFAANAPSDAAEALQAELSSALEAARLYRPEKRAFWPHLTVARVRPERGSGKRPQRVEALPGPFPEAVQKPFDGVRMTLYRSDLGPGGAEYTPLATVEMPQPGSGAAEAR